MCVGTTVCVSCVPCRHVRMFLEKKMYVKVMAFAGQFIQIRKFLQFVSDPTAELKSSENFHPPLTSPGQENHPI